MKRMNWGLLVAMLTREMAQDELAEQTGCGANTLGHLLRGCTPTKGEDYPRRLLLVARRRLSPNQLQKCGVTE